MIVRPWGKDAVSGGAPGTPWYRRAYFDALAVVSPVRAATIWHFDRMDRDPNYREAVHMGMRAMGYVSKGPNSTPWPKGGGPRSADAEVLGDLPDVRERARVCGRRDPVGAGLILQFVQEMVGVGVGDRATTGDPKKDAAINEEWAELQKGLLPAEAIKWFVGQLTIAERVVEDGEMWLRRVKLTPDSPLTYELVEGDRVLTPSDVQRLLEEGHTVRDGVERDANDHVVAYWISKSHPGNVAIQTAVMGATIPSLALTAKDFDRLTLDQAKHVRLPGRPGQSRSLSILKSVLQNLRDMDLTIDAGMKRIQIAAMFAVFIETASNIPDIVQATRKKFDYQMDQDLVPGMIFVLRPGEKATTVNPQFPIPDLEVLQKILARRIGAALGISWRVVLCDLGEANFSAARADRIEFEEAVAIPRMIVVDGFDWMRTGALEDALLRGSPRLLAAGVTIEDLARVTWLKRAKEWLDPKAESEGATAALTGKLITKRDYHAARGKDWEEELDQQLAEEVAERAKRAKLELGGIDAAQQLVLAVTAVTAILVAVGNGTLAPESAIALIVASFPKVTKEQAEAMVGPAKAIAASATKPAKDQAATPTPPAETKPRHLNGAQREPELSHAA